VTYGHQRRRSSPSQWYIFNKIVAEKFPDLKKEMPIQVQEVSRIPNKHDQNRTSPWHIIIKKLALRTRRRY
jgi:hypothetical protein